MMDKQKRKVHPYNSRQYWMIFSLLAITLLIPFRIVGFWMLTNIIYISISIGIGIALIRFIRRYSWKRWIVTLMLFCSLLSIFQVFQITYGANCDYPVVNNILICRTDCPLAYFLVVPETSIGIQIEPYPITIGSPYVCADSLW